MYATLSERKPSNIPSSTAVHSVHGAVLIEDFVAHGKFFVSEDSSVYYNVVPRLNSLFSPPPLLGLM